MKRKTYEKVDEQICETTLGNLQEDVYNSEMLGALQENIAERICEVFTMLTYKNEKKYEEEVLKNLLEAESKTLQIMNNVWALEKNIAEKCEQILSRYGDVAKNIYGNINAFLRKHVSEDVQIHDTKIGANFESLSVKYGVKNAQLWYENELWNICIEQFPESFLSQESFDEEALHILWKNGWKTASKRMENTLQAIIDRQNIADFNGVFEHRLKHEGTINIVLNAMKKEGGNTLASQKILYSIYEHIFQCMLKDVENLGLQIASIEAENELFEQIENQILLMQCALKDAVKNKKRKLLPSIQNVPKSVWYACLCAMALGVIGGYSYKSIKTRNTYASVNGRKKHVKSIREVLSLQQKTTENLMVIKHKVTGEMKIIRNDKNLLNTYQKDSFDKLEDVSIYIHEASKFNKNESTFYPQKVQQLTIGEHTYFLNELPYKINKDAHVLTDEKFIDYFHIFSLDALSGIGVTPGGEPLYTVEVQGIGDMYNFQIVNNESGNIENSFAFYARHVNNYAIVLQLIDLLKKRKN